MSVSSEAAVSRTPLVRTGLLLQWTFFAILALWVFYGAMRAPGQDALPYVTAGHLARSHPGDVYPAEGQPAVQVSPRFRATGCPDAPADSDCASWVIAYVTSPQLLPFAVALDGVFGGSGVRVMTTGSSLLLVAGMLLLWRRLADRDPRAPLVLVVTALAASPLALFAIFMGQTSPVMFLSVCLGVATGSRWRRVVTGVVWAMSSLLKVFPAALGLLLLRRRRRDVLVAGITTVVALTLVSIVLLPASIWGHFLDNLARGGSAADPNHTGAALSTNLLRLFGESPVAHVVAVVVPLVVASVFAALGLRKGGDDARWAVGYVALLLVAPVVWNHYLLVLVGAVGVVLADRSRLGRELYALPVAGFLVSIPILLNRLVPEPVRITSQVVCLIIGAAIVLWVVNLDREQSQTVTAPIAQ